MKNRNDIRSPVFGEKILKCILPGIEAESIAGDYEEIYKDLVLSKGKFFAWGWYWFQILKSFCITISVWFSWSCTMFKNYLKITWRNIKRHKSYSIINISGLALGIACCILIMLWVEDELSWDRFHKNAENIYRVVQKQADGHLTPVTPAPLAGHLKSEYPEVIEAARYRRFWELNFRYEDKSFVESPLVADPAFFKIFSFPLIEGDPDSIFNNRNSMVITQELAQKFFGQDDPVGKIITVNNRADFQVTGVIRDVPPNSTLRFNCVLPFELLTQGRGGAGWRESSTWTYIRLENNISAQGFDEKISGIVSSRHADNSARLQLQPLLNLHLRPQGNRGPIIYIYIFSAMGVFILLIACINFINLMTARSAERSREVGLRKVIGAKRANLIRQFFGESFLYTFVAVFVAVFMVWLFMPVFNNLSAKQFSLSQDLLGNMNLVAGIIGITILTGLLSGSYPALLLASFQPVTALKVAKARSVPSRSPMLRRILVVIQFSLSIFLMIGTFVIFQQLRYIRNKDLGFDKSYIVCSDSGWEPTRDIQTIKTELQQHPRVLNMTFSSQKMGDWESGARDDVVWDGKKENLHLTFEVIFCDYDFQETHSMQMAQGRFFSQDLASDLRESFIINEAAAQAMGFGQETPVGKRLSFWDDYDGNIIGVIKDFHTQSLHNQIQPVIMVYDPRHFDNISVRISSEDVPETLAFLEEKWQELNPGFSLRHFFLDENLDRRYRAEQATSSLMKYFTFLAVFISCIGLLGLISFLTQQRTKEIGIRKVLGASVPGVIQLFLKEFVLLVALANILAWPLAYVSIRSWLGNFAYRTQVEAYVFALAGGLTLIIALITVSFQAFKAAAASPADSLRYE